MEGILLDALATYGFNLTSTLGSAAWLSKPAFLQSFEATSLKKMATRSCLPLVLLLAQWENG